MKATKLRWKLGLVLASMLLATTFVLSGCAAEEEKPTLKFVDTQYETQWLMNAVAEIVLGEGYGYPVEAVQTTVSVGMASLSKGDIEVWLDLWEWYFLTWWEPAMANGEIETLGVSMDSAPSFWIIPQWVHEEYGINTVFDLKEHWELFQDPEDPSKGLFINCPIGWNCQQINTVKLEGYGLT